MAQVNFNSLYNILYTYLQIYTPEPPKRPKPAEPGGGRSPKQRGQGSARGAAVIHCIPRGTT